MAKRTGIGDRLYYGGYDLSGDVGSVGAISTPRSVLDVTGLPADGHERLLGLADGSLSFSAFWNDANSAPAVRGQVTSDVVVSYWMGTAAGGIAGAMVSKITEVSGSRGEDGSLALSVNAAANGAPFEWGTGLTNGTVAAASAGTVAPVDHGAATAYGGAAYVHVLSIGSGTATVKVRHSADNSTYTDLITPTAASGATSERATTAAVTTSVNRYAAIQTTGTFTNLVYAVVFVRFTAPQT